MKWLFLILFSVVSFMGLAQQADSLKRIDPKERSQKSETNSDDKESFGDYVQKVGLGLWGRVKERFNLEGMVENLEEKKNKFLGDKKEDVSKDKNEKVLKEGATKESPPKSDT